MILVVKPIAYSFYLKGNDDIVSTVSKLDIKIRIYAICVISNNAIVCKTLVPPKNLEKFWFSSPFFSPTPNLKNYFPPFLSQISEELFRANFSLKYKNHCENTIYYQSSMVCTINVPKDCFLHNSCSILIYAYKRLSCILKEYIIITKIYVKF